MENIIDKLLEIDRQACQVVETAAKQRESSAANRVAVKKEIYAAAMDEAHAKAESYRAAAKQNADKLTAALAAEYEQNRAALERTYNSGCSDWVDTIVENCIKR